MSLRTLVLVLLPAACTGGIGDAEHPGASATAPSPMAPPGSRGSAPAGALPAAPGLPPTSAMPVPPSPQTVAACRATSPGPSPLRRLTRLEYAHTVRDLLGVTDSPSVAFAPDAHALGFDNIASAQSVSPLLVEQYEDGAARLAAAAVLNLPRLLACDVAATGEEACARKFISDFGRRAWRGPPSTVDRDRLIAFYAAQKARHGFAGAIEQTVAALLQSPRFLYRVEIGGDPFALASRLSYLVWSSMPDEVLLAAAENGRLSTPQDLAAQAERMLADPKARPAIAHFHRQWLELEAIDEVTKDAKIYPAFTPALRTLMKREGTTFLEELFFKGDAKLATLLTAEHTFANAQLASFYGLMGPAGSAFERATLPPTRGGFLTQAGFLSVHAKPNQSSPIDRGKFIRERLLCQDLPAPPNDMEIVPPAVKPGQSTRQRFKAHTENPSCGGCHALIDPTGFPLESFDGMGAWRDRDQGVVVDTSGDLTGTDVSGPFTGAVELARRLAASEMVRGCVVTQWFRYAHGREETEGDACTVAMLRDQFRAGNHDLRKLVVALTQTPAFQIRSAGGTP